MTKRYRKGGRERGRGREREVLREVFKKVQESRFKRDTGRVSLKGERGGWVGGEG